MQNQRIDYIDAIKGFAAICVIIGHVCDGYLGSGIFGADNVLLVTIFKIVYAFHMALFFIISGFLFNGAYVGTDGAIKKEKLKPQLFNIAFVYVLFSMFLWVFKLFFAQLSNKPVAVKDILFIWCKTIGPYWYLYVLLVIYLLMMLFKPYKSFMRLRKNPSNIDKK